MRTASFVVLLLLGAISSTEGIKIGIKEGDEGTDQLIALGNKLGLEVTADMFVGQSSEDVSSAIIGAALESGKTQEQIEAAMSGDASAAATTTQSTAQVEATTETVAAPSTASAGSGEKLTAVKVDITKAGTGKACKDGDIATMNYTGKLYNDQSVVFDSSIPRGEAFDFTVGGYTVIKCWQTAVMQMRSGDQGTILCPAKTAYGKAASGKIPANSDLLFEVTVEKCVDMFAK